MMVFIHLYVPCRQMQEDGIMNAIINHISQTISQDYEIVRRVLSNTLDLLLFPLSRRLISARSSRYSISIFLYRQRSSTYSYDEMTVLCTDYRISSISCQRSSSCLESTMLAMFADFSSPQIAYFFSISPSTSLINYFSRVLLDFYKSILNLLTSSYIILALQPWMVLTSESNLTDSSSSICLTIKSLSFSYLSFSFLYFSNLFSNLLISCWLHLTSSSSVFLFSRSSCRLLFNFLHCADSSSTSSSLISSCFRRFSYLSLLHFFYLQLWSIFMEPELLLSGISKGSANSLKKFYVSISSLLILFGLQIVWLFSRSGEEAMSCSYTLANFLSEPERQFKVWKELRRTNRLEFYVWVGSEPLLIFFLALMQRLVFKAEDLQGQYNFIQQNQCQDRQERMSSLS